MYKKPIPERLVRRALEMPNIPINNEPLTLKFDLTSERRPEHVPASVFIKAKYKRLYKRIANNQTSKGRNTLIDNEHEETDLK
jgi:hypothetical protein